MNPWYRTRRSAAAPTPRRLLAAIGDMPALSVYRYDGLKESPKSRACRMANGWAIRRLFKRPMVRVIMMAHKTQDKKINL